MRGLMRRLLVSAALLGSTLAADPGPPTADNPNWFPFPISVMDSTKTPIDLSFLNEKPAGTSGYLKADGEHIVDGKGQPVRLFGTNFCFGANFPEPADAEKVAAHLAKNGLNIVRLHHMDNDWGESLIVHEGQLDATGKIVTRLHEKNIAKLDKLVAEFIKNGIYINLNLHVSRTYPGTPKDAPQYSKGLDYFYPPFIAAFKDYARQLLNHVNPHTGRAYKDEPGVAIIEMNNENTLVLNPWWMAKLEEPFVSELRALFVKHLQKKYPSIEKLREVWGLNDGSTGPNLIVNGDFSEGTKAWQSEANFGSKATLEQRSADTPVRNVQRSADTPVRRTSPDSESNPAIDATKPEDARQRAGVPALLSFIRWTSTQSGKENYSLQFSQPGLHLEEAKAYRLSFRARSDKSAMLDVHAQNSAAPWAQLGMQEKMQLKPEWQDFSFEFSPHSVLPDGKNRIVFSLLNEVTSVDIADVKLVSISTGYLKPEHSFTANNLPIPNRNAKIEVRWDFFDFLMQLEIDHALAMKKFIREEIGAKQMISHSQVLFGGVVGARREFIVSDVVDTHGYWHHPHFPRKSWDMSDWEINNVSQLASEEGGTLAEMAMQRPFGKPYSVSEYDTPAPNDYAAETFPMLAAMACLQDWSAVYHFNFKGNGKYDSDKITSFFDLPGHPGKQAFMPLAALVFRKGLIEPATTQVGLPLQARNILELASDKAGDVWGGWRDVWARRKVTGIQAWRSRVGLELSPGKSPGRLEFKDFPRRDGSREFVVGRASDLPASSTVDFSNASLSAGIIDSAWILAAKKENVISMSGRLGGVELRSNTSSSLLIMVPLDDIDPAKAKKLWLCALSRAENPGMGWDKDRRSVSNKWGTGPALVLGVNATIKLPRDATWKIEALDPTGAPKAVIAEKTNDFQIDPSQKTCWWLMTRE